VAVKVMVGCFARQALKLGRDSALPAVTCLPTGFKRAGLLIIGCGDIGLRVARLLHGNWRLIALTSSPARCATLRAAGVLPLLGNLDDVTTLNRLAGLADAVLHLAPPPGQGADDPRTAALLQALARKGRVRRIVYASTTGVYGDCGGARFDETRNINPQTDRARRRVDAEQRLRWYGRACGARVTLLRIPGIYALDRPGGDPRERLSRATPVLRAEDDVHTNHIHADDLARACVAALRRGLPQRVVHVCDDSMLKMGDHFDLVAQLTGMPRPPRISREQAAQQLSPLQMSFLGESRSLANLRLKRELGVRLRYPTIVQGLARKESPGGPEVS
jgi:nucleoside-diphosphate-sugar epimerase